MKNGKYVKTQKLLVVNFRYTTEENFQDYLQDAKNAIKKGRNKKALRYLNRGVKETPYLSSLYYLRAQVNEKLGKNDNANNDLLLAQKIDNDLYCRADIMVLKFIYP